MDEPRFVICCAPADGQSCCQLAPPSLLDHRPFCATLVISMSRSGCAVRYGVLPHSEAMPARLAVTFVHSAGGVAPTGMTVIPPAPVAPPVPPPPGGPAPGAEQLASGASAIRIHR